MYSNIRSLAMTLTVALVAGFALPSVCQADIFGLYVGDYELNFPDDGSPPIVGDDYIQLTTGGEQRRSLFFNEAQDITRFTASFTFRVDYTYWANLGAGLCFVIQNSDAGVEALGDWTFGYGGIDKSAAVTLEMYYSKSGFYKNGNVTNSSGSTAPVLLPSGNEIDVTIEYDKPLLSVQMVDSVTGEVYSSGDIFVDDLTEDIGGDTAFVGITATANGNTANYHLSNFRFFTDGCPADFNQDGTSDTQDFIAFLNAWSNGDASADFNEDGTVDIQDFIAFLNAWAAGCP